MKDRPEGLDEPRLRRALDAWGIDAVSLAYAPVGFGDYHWTAVDGRERQWFVTVADLAHKRHCGDGPEAAFGGLRRAMDTAWALRHQGELGFVVAPLPTADGETVRRLGARHALSVFPFVDGTPGRFGQTLTPAERGPVVDLLAELHRRTPPASAPVLQPDLPARVRLEEALEELDRPWQGGPFAEPARVLVSECASGFRRRLDEFDRRVGEVSRRCEEPVVTHGEPHPGNLLRLETGACWSTGTRWAWQCPSGTCGWSPRSRTTSRGTPPPPAGVRIRRPWRSTVFGGTLRRWPFSSTCYAPPMTGRPMPSRHGRGSPAAWNGRQVGREIGH